MRKAAFARTSQAFAFAGRRISRCRAAMTPEQEKALHDALDRRAGELATLLWVRRRLSDTRRVTSPASGEATNKRRSLPAAQQFGLLLPNINSAATAQ